jgi:hypothetical protein
MELLDEIELDISPVSKIQVHAGIYLDTDEVEQFVLSFKDCRNPSHIRNYQINFNSMGLPKDQKTRDWVASVLASEIVGIIWQVEQNLKSHLNEKIDDICTILNRN